MYYYIVSSLWSLWPTQDIILSELHILHGIKKKKRQTHINYI